MRGHRAQAGARGLGYGFGRDVETGGVLAGGGAAQRLRRARDAWVRRSETRREVAAVSWWTEEQDDVLREVSFQGAVYAAAEIERRCGVAHSVRAVEMRASRIHCSLAVQTVCPECGAVGVKINRQTGMCRRCTEEYHLEQERAFNEQLERERIAAEEAPEIDDVRRERDKIQQRNSRLCRKFGLSGRRERKG